MDSASPNPSAAPARLQLLIYGPIQIIPIRYSLGKSISHGKPPANANPPAAEGMGMSWAAFASSLLGMLEKDARGRLKQLGFNTGDNSRDVDDKIHPNLWKPHFPSSGMN